jgi:gamma-glutamyl-gamma-aminobutyrate hydrolase PuuD
MKVAVTQRVVRDAAYGEIRDALCHDWYKFFSALDVDAVVPVPNIEDGIGAWIEAIKPDLIVFSGGNDVEYGQAVHIPEQINVLRDRTEIKLLDTAISKGIPVLGVCRGMQLMYAYYGGILQKREEHAGTVHPIRYKDHPEGTWNNREVNSFHHYCIGDRLPEQLIPICYDTNDGSVEAFVHWEYPLLGVMWHPERNQPFEEIDLRWIRQLSKGLLWR